MYVYTSFFSYLSTVYNSIEYTVGYLDVILLLFENEWFLCKKVKLKVSAIYDVTVNV